MLILQPEKYKPDEAGDKGENKYADAARRTRKKERVGYHKGSFLTGFCSVIL